MGSFGGENGNAMWYSLLERSCSWEWRPESVTMCKHHEEGRRPGVGFVHQRGSPTACYQPRQSIALLEHNHWSLSICPKCKTQDDGNFTMGLVS